MNLTFVIFVFVIFVSCESKLAITIETVYDLLKGNVPNFIENGPHNHKLIFEEVMQMFNTQSNDNALFRLFKRQFHKTYETPENETTAKEHFLARVKMIKANNLKYIFKHSDYLLALNSRSDQEFIKILWQPAGDWPKMTENYQNSSMFETRLSYPEIGPIVNQSVCVASLYFTVAVAIENAMARKGWNHENLSVQQMIDCSYNETLEQLGCSNDGTYEHILEYVRLKGLTSWRNYSYRGLTQECQASKENQTVAQITSFHQVPADESALLKALDTHGPIAVKIHMNEELSHLKSGVFSGNCNGEPNLGALLVGYKEDKFFIIKNQWGKSFGENGYLRIKRNSGNLCGIASKAFYVEV